MSACVVCKCYMGPLDYVIEPSDFKTENQALLDHITQMLWSMRMCAGSHSILPECTRLGFSSTRCTTPDIFLCSSHCVKLRKNN